MAEHNFRSFSGSNEDVLHWIRHIEMHCASNGLSDQQVLCKACANLTGAAAFWLDTVELTNWSDFKCAIISRFGEQPEVIANKLYSCRQQKGEDIAQYSDRFQRLNAKLILSENSLPSCILLRLFLEGLRPELRTKVINNHPLTLEQAVNHARYLQEFQPLQADTMMFVSSDNDRRQRIPQAYQEPSQPAHQDRPPYERQRPPGNNRQQHPQHQQRQQQRQQPQQQGTRTWPPRGHQQRQPTRVDELQRQMENLQLEIAQAKGAEAQVNTGQMVNLHAEDDVDEQLQAHYHDWNDDGLSYDEPEHNAWAYAEDISMPDAAPIAPRRPRHRVSFDPHNMPTRNDPSPGNGQQPARSPPGRGRPPAVREAPAQPRSFPRPQPAQIQHPRELPEPAPAPRHAPAPRRPPAKGNFQISDQLNSTAAKISIGELLRLAPGPRAEMKAVLEKIEAEERVQRSNTTYAAMESYIPPAVALSPDPVAYRHSKYDNLADTNANISVVKANVSIGGTEISAIIDSGASHTMMSDVMARKLQLYRSIQPTKAKFYTSSGKLESPVGRLTDVSISVGNLTLPVDIYVSPARTYNLLLGNNFLAAAEAEINFGSKLLIYRRDLDTYEAVPLQFTEPAPDIPRTTVACMMQSTHDEHNGNYAHLLEEDELRPEELEEGELDPQAQQEQPQEAADKATGQPQPHEPSQPAEAPSEAELTPDSSSDTEVTSSEDGDSDALQDSQDDEFEYTEYDETPAEMGSNLATLCEANLQTLCNSTDTVADSLPLQDGEIPLHMTQGCLDYIIKSAYGHEVVHMLPDPSSSPTRDTEDWQLDPCIFFKHFMTYGPFEVDACADVHGDNAQLDEYWCVTDSCLNHSWCGKNVYCNPPWRLIDSTIAHFLQCKQKNPDHTHAVFVLPNWPWQAWYPTVMQHFDIIDYYPSGSQLFTAPAPFMSGTRVSLGPTRWPVMIVKDTMRKGTYDDDWARKYRPSIGKLEEDLQHELTRDTSTLKIGQQLTKEQQNDIQELLSENEDVFAWSDADNGRTHVVAHEIDTGEAKPLKQRPYRLSPEEDDIVDSEVDKWLQQGIVIPSDSPWASPVVLVKKKPLDPNDASEKPKYRLCIDFRKVNRLTKTDSFPLPVIQDALDGLADAQYFSIVDLRSAFLQLPLHPRDRQKTAFITKQGLYEFTVLPFGLKNSPAVFQRLMTEVLQGLQGSSCTVFLDDIIIYSSTWESHLYRLREVLGRLRHHNLHAHPDKCKFGTHELLYLGHVVNGEGNQVDPNKVSAITNISPPQDQTEVRAFLGLVGYYRRFIPGFAATAAPLHQLLKKSSDLQWSSECQAAFETLKQRLIEPPILKRPLPHGVFTLQTDWSTKAIAAVLCQEQDGRECTIAYASKSLTPTERNYSATEGECLAIIWACKHFRHYLWGRAFFLQTDHQALKWLMSTTDLTGKLARWSLKLQEYTFEIKYRPGSANGNADALTRLPIRDDSNLVIQLCTSQLTDALEKVPKRRRLHRPAAQPLSNTAEATGSYRPAGTHPCVITTPVVTPRTTPTTTSIATPASRPSTTLAVSPITTSADATTSAPALDKTAVIQNLKQQQLNASGGGCYHLLSGEQLWRDYLEEHGLSPLETGDPDNQPPSTAGPSSQAAEEGTPDCATEEQSDRSDSISISLPCEVCQSGSDDSSMLVCDSCNKGFHTYCLKPAVLTVPEGSWYCGDCGGNTQTSTDTIDITQDKNVLKHLTDGPQAAWTLTERKRAYKRANNYYVTETRALYRKPVVSHGKQYPARPVLGVADRQRAIRSCHELSHSGVMRTAALVSERYYWGGIVEDCRDFIRGCHQCQLQNARFTEPQKLHSIPVTDQSFHQVGIDLVGPLYPSASHNKYIIVAMDYLTKWPEVQAVPDKTAQRVADFFMEYIVARHGCPNTVISDNGSEFQGEFASLLQSLNIDHRHSSPNHPTTNGLVEHFNGTLVTALRKSVSHHQLDWDRAIPLTLLGYRASIQVSTRYTPFFMLYARQPVLPIETDSDAVDIQELMPEAAAQVITSKAKTLKDVITSAMGNIAKAQAKQQRDYKVKRKYVEPTKLKPGDFIVIKAPERRSKLTAKAQDVILILEDFTNEEKTMAVVRDASEPPKRWKENVSNIAKYDFT